jgi:hypothetical protein
MAALKYLVEEDCDGIVYNRNGDLGGLLGIKRTNLRQLSFDVGS